MRQQCVNAVVAAIGRPISDAEARNIETRILDSMTALARQDPARWQTLTRAQRMAEAAKFAAQELVAEAQLRKTRLAQAIAAHDRIEQYTADQVAAGIDDTKLGALTRLIAGRSDGKNNSTSVEVNALGIMAGTMGRLDEAWAAIHPRFLGLFANKEAEDQFVRAAYGETQGIRPEMVAAAKAWRETMERLRQRFNAGGGDVGKLDNWGLPQSWSQDIAIKRGRDAFVREFMGHVDRSIYRHPDGRKFNDAEMEAFLGEAWLSIATNGANKPIRPGQTGGSIKANRHNQARQLHFRSPDAALEAMRAWSGKSVFEAMAGHVRRMSRDIALVEQFGPNADHMVSVKVEQYAKEAALANIGKGEYDPAKVDKAADKATNLYNFVAGNAPPPTNRKWANALAGVRAILSAAKLGSATITSISDEGTLHLTGRVNNLSGSKLFLNEVRAYNLADRAEKRMAKRAGLLVNTMLDEVNRFGDETMGAQMPQRITSAVLRLSGLNAITEARRRAFSVTMLDAIGSLTRRYQSVSGLNANDWRTLKAKGIDQATWDIWRQAQPDDWGQGATVLTPESIYAIKGVDTLAKDRAATKLLAVVMDERDIAVITPGVRERSAMLGKTKGGDLDGEILRTFWQFKSFPFAMISRHWGRGLGMYENTSGKAGYLATLLAAQTVMGGIALEISDILNGRDPRSLNPESDYGPRNMLAALLKGGGMGLYGDFLFAEATDYGRSFAGAVGGPGLGLIEDTYKLTIGNIRQGIKGEETNFGAEAVRFTRGNLPGASLWYTKAATDRLVFHQLQEYFNPGYLRRAERKARQDFGTKYWWSPGAMPDEARPPDLTNVVADQ